MNLYSLEQPLVLIKFQLLPELKWLESFILPATIPLVSQLILEIKLSKTIEPEDKKYLFIEDNPIKSNNRRPFHNTILDAIKLYDYKNSFSIAILGAWGHGKTTFVEQFKELTKKEFKEHELISFNFSPFFNHNNKNIVSEFFNGLDEALSPYSGSLGTSITQYANSLTKLYKRGEIVDFLNSGNSIEGKSAFNYYSNLKEQIKRLNKKIVVYIDDFDRLEKEEIIEVLKLIRNTSNFQNVFFLVCLDNSHVIKKLGESENYLSKFFQLEFVLPELSSEDLADSLENHLTNSDVVIPEKKLNILKNEIRSENSIFREVIKNHRDVIKSANRLILEIKLLPKLLDEVSIVDVFYTSILKAKYYKLFKSICENTNDLFKQDDGLMLMKVKEPEVFKERFNSKGVYVDLEKWDLTDVFKEKHFGSIDKVAKALIWHLFTSINQVNDSIRHSRNFSRIIKLQHHESDLRSTEIDELFDLNNSHQEQVDKIISDGKYDQLIIKISEFETSIKEKQERKISIAFYLLSQLSKVAKNSKDEVTIRLLIKKYFNPDYKKSNFSIEEQQNLFNKEFLQSDKINHLQRLTEICEILKRREIYSQYGFKEEELKRKSEEIFNDYFKQPCNQPWKVEDEQSRNMFYILKDIVGLEKSERIFKSNINEKNLEVICIQNINNVSPYLFQVSDFFLQELFPNPESFYEWIKTKKFISEGLIEYKKFLEIAKIKNFQTIKYNFRELDVSKRIVNDNDLEIKLKNKSKVEMFIQTTNDKFSVTFPDQANDNWNVNQYDNNIHIASGYTVDIDECLKRQVPFLKHINQPKNEQFTYELDINTTKKSFQIKDSNGKVVIESISIQYGK